MKYTLLQVGVLGATVALIVLAGRAPATNWWGPEGVRSLYAAAIICFVAAFLAAIPLGLTATYWKAYAPHAAFAGTAIRLLVTAGLALAYQLAGTVEIVSFLMCLGGVYLILLLVETLLISFIVFRVMIKPTKPASDAE